MGGGPLAGVRIVEIASLAPAPFGCMLLADLGAEVVRVGRLGGEPALALPTGPLDRGRRSIAVDLKTAGGVGVVRRLADEADVFVEGFRPGVAERLGIGPDDLTARNPRLVYGRMTGWGQRGPLSARAGHDINYVAIAGALEPIGRAGEAPHPALNLIADFAGGGAFLAIGILAALYERAASGLGQIVDAAMVDGASALMSFVHGMHAAGRWSEVRGTNLLDGGAPFYDTYETADGRFVAVGAIEPLFYRRLLDTLGIDPEALTDQHDPGGWPLMRSRFAAAFASRTRDEWTAVFADSDACVSPVLAPWEAHEHPHHRERGSFVEVGGTIQPAPAPRFSRSVAPAPVEMDRGGRDVALTLADWGFDAAEAAALIARGTVA